MTGLWRPFSRIFMVNDSAFWVISWEMKEVGLIAQKLGKRLAPTWLLPFTDRQSVFFGSHFHLLLDEKWFNTSCRFATAYFHGRPGTGSREFDICFENLCKYHDRIHRIQVSHTEMRDLVLSSGISPEKIFLIPIGVNLKYFIMRTKDMQEKVRRKVGIPLSAFVVGSFQKDGVGWGEGLEPKLVKGPDVFLSTVKILKKRIPELFVLLSGPSRGYVKKGLVEMGVPFKYCFFQHYPEIVNLYSALDVYIVASREEGGPKGVLESMATGVPLVTTRVGQAMDLVQHGKNGWMVPIGDADAIAEWVVYVAEHGGSLENMVQQGRITAERNSYEAQVPMWSNFFKRFVE